MKAIKKKILTTEITRFFAVFLHNFEMFRRVADSHTVVNIAVIQIVRTT